MANISTVEICACIFRNPGRRVMLVVGDIADGATYGISTNRNP